MKRIIKIFTAALCACLLLAFSACSITDLFQPKESPAPQPHLIAEEAAEQNPIRFIDSCEQRAVTGDTFKQRQDSLSSLVAKGYKPAFDEQSADAEAVYNAAVAVLNRYILNSFTPYERVHAIHDYLCYYVEYDAALYERYLSGDKSISSDDDSFNISGVFLNKSAVCDGIARAFNLLCDIEGIESVRIAGEYTGENGTDAHAWNKVKVDGQWYNADATMDRAQISLNGEVKSFMHHGYFMLSDRAMRDNTFGRHIASPDLADNPVNELTPEESYPVYEQLSMDIKGETYDCLITTQSQLDELITAVRKAGRAVGKLDIRLDLEGVSANRVGAFDSYLLKAFENLKNSDFDYNPNIGTRPYVQYPDGRLLLLIYI